MRNIILFSIIIVLNITLNSCEESKSDRNILGKKIAEQELNASLNDSLRHNLIDNNTIILKDSITIISIAEPILFSIYGKENIINQRPYEMYLINNYWIIMGTLNTNQKGGTFQIIIDSRNCEIINITHGK